MSESDAGPARGPVGVLEPTSPRAPAGHGDPTGLGDPAGPGGTAAPPEATAHEYWGARSQEYDDFIRRVVPRYDEMMERLLEGVPTSVTSVLELGCGTGNLSLRLVRHAPAARFTFVDASLEMVATVRARLGAEAPEAAARSTFVVDTFENLHPEPGAHDLVVACLSLHHVGDLAPVYSALSAGMAPGGRFRSCDGVRAAGPGQHALERARWEAWWREGGRLSAEEIASVTDHVARHDHYETLEDHFRMLSAAGLVHPDCLWRDGMFAVIAAEGAPGPRSPSNGPA